MSGHGRVNWFYGAYEEDGRVLTHGRRTEIVLEDDVTGYKFVISDEEWRESTKELMGIMLRALDYVRGVVSESLATCLEKERRCVGFENATGLKKKSTAKLQDSRTVRKIVNLDDHIALACPGLKANARVLINKVRIECQSHQLTVEDLVTVEYITCYIAGLQQKYTQSGCVRSFGLSTLIIGFDPYTGAPTLYQTDPSGTFSTWKANGTGRNSNSLREFPEKNYKETTRQQTVKLALSALLEVSNSKRCIFNLVS
ncbi:proteasome subunit alpha type-7-like [Humulus lupulus]|uniref:proteasome subunit alpha type-7-like n=1 Tax=Humulus lupulus TaxID=3486 RepID=UPI002B416204|nr:proteasome subunit alpha type-7-like [Humulus lupulus]